MEFVAGITRRRQMSLTTCETIAFSADENPCIKETRSCTEAFLEGIVEITMHHGRNHPCTILAIHQLQKQIGPWSEESVPTCCTFGNLSGQSDLQCILLLCPLLRNRSYDSGQWALLDIPKAISISQLTSRSSGA